MEPAARATPAGVARAAREAALAGRRVQQRVASVGGQLAQYLHNNGQLSPTTGFVTGYDFMVAVNTAGNAAYKIPTGPWYHFMASLVYNVPILTILIVGSFLFWSLPAMVGNTFMPIRTVFAWSFDRLLPERFSSVNERTHSPVPAILLVMGLVTLMLAWSVVSTDFATWLALGVLAGVVCVVIVGVAAFVFPERRPDLYRASPANISWARVTSRRTSDAARWS